MNEHQQKVYIKLIDIGNRRDALLKILSNIQGLRDTPEQLIARVPCHISGKVSLSLAEKVKYYLEKAGAVVELQADDLPDTAQELSTFSDSDIDNAPSADSFTEPGYRLTEFDNTEDVAIFEVEETDSVEDALLPPVFTSDTLPYTSAEPQEPSPPQRYQLPLTKTAQPFDESLYDEIEPPQPRRPRQRKPTRSINPLYIVGLVLAVLIALVSLWMLFSGGFSRLAQRYEKNPLLGEVGVLKIENDEGAVVRLYHVIGTRVIKQIPLEGLTANLLRGDYYVEAVKNAEILSYPVYIKGRGHRVTVTTSFAEKASALPDTAYIPAGWFRMGNKITVIEHFGFPDERPDIDVYISGFYLSQYEVTNREFLRFITAGGYETEDYWERLIQDWPSLAEQAPSYERVYGNDGWNSVKKYIHRRFVDTDDRPGPRLWEKDTPPYEEGQGDHPVSGISFYEAEAYCKWRTLQTGKLHRLPTEAEWEKAARGYEGYFFSYGNEYDGKRANTETGEPQKIGSYPPNSYGLYDMTGNIWEWTADHYDPNSYQQLYDQYGSDIRDPHIVSQTQPYNRVVIRGGSFRSVNRVNARTPVRYPMFPNDWHTNIGFRYVVEP